MIKILIMESDIVTEILIDNIYFLCERTSCYSSD